MTKQGSLKITSTYKIHHVNEFPSLLEFVYYKQIMRIIIPRITETTTQQDLEDFVGQALKYWGVFTYIAKSSIYDYRILAVDDGQDGLIYHGLIDVKDKKVASRLIRKLNGKRLNNEKVEVRLFVNRHAWSGLYLVENERRRMNMALM